MVWWVVLIIAITWFFEVKLNQAQVKEDIDALIGLAQTLQNIITLMENTEEWYESLVSS